MRKCIVSALLVGISAFVAFLYFSATKFDPKTIRDKRVLITGASQGIGEQLAYLYSKLGARVVITARREDVLKSVAKKCKKLGARQIEIVAADMANATDRSKVVDHVQKHLGGLDHLILNHALLVQGWWLGTPGNVSTLETTFKVNYMSYVDMASKTLDMLTSSRGNIGIVSSGFGEFGTPRTTVYSSCKFALHGFFSALRQELIVRNKLVSVTLVVLGPISSDSFMSMRSSEFPHMPLGLLATPLEAAGVILESVAMRCYKVRYNGFTRLMLFCNELWPGFFEDEVANVLLDPSRSYFARVFIFVTSVIYD